KGLLHMLLPGVLIAGLCWLLQKARVAYRLDPHQTQTARTRFLLRHRHRFGWHLVRQTGTFLLAIRYDRGFNAPVDLLLRPVGSADKPMEARELSQQTHQTNPTGPDFGTHQVYRQNQTMEEGETGDAMKKCHDSGTRVEALLVGTPRLQRRA